MKSKQKLDPIIQTQVHRLFCIPTVRSSKTRSSSLRDERKLQARENSDQEKIPGGTEEG